MLRRRFGRIPVIGSYLGLTILRKDQGFYIGRGVDPAHVLRSKFTVNEFIPLLHAKCSIFPVWWKTLKYEFGKSRFLAIGWSSNPLETNISRNGTKGIIPDQRTGPLWHTHLKHFPGCCCFAHGKPQSPLFSGCRHCYRWTCATRRDLDCFAKLWESHQIPQLTTWTICFCMGTWHVAQLLPLLKSRFT